MIIHKKYSKYEPWNSVELFIINALVIMFVIITILALSGCSGLNVSWQASYNMPQTACVANASLPCPAIIANKPVLP